MARKYRALDASAAKPRCILPRLGARSASNRRHNKGPVTRRGLLLPDFHRFSFPSRIFPAVIDMISDRWNFRFPSCISAFAIAPFRGSGFPVIVRSAWKECFHLLRHFLFHPFIVPVFMLCRCPRSSLLRFLPILRSRESPGCGSFGNALCRLLPFYLHSGTLYQFQLCVTSRRVIVRFCSCAARTTFSKF